MFKNIEECLKWVMSRKGHNSFDKFKKVMQLLGNPQNSFKSIHIAGTNGKGSTLAYLRAILIDLGFKVGSLQSPHFKTHLDRIRINYNNIDELFFLDCVNDYYEFILKHNLNMFEIDFIIMALYFKKENIDYAIIEVGMGGRFDSTNCLKNPLLSIITNISFDHIEYLGNSLSQIAFEKAGIIKENSIVLSGELNPLANNVISNIARFKNSDFKIVCKLKTIDEHSYYYKGAVFNLENRANYQLKNSFLALQAFEIIAQKEGIKYNLERISKLYKTVVWDGRFQILNENPKVIIDGAHNVAGIQALLNSLNNEKEVAFIFSAMVDKEYLKMISLLKNKASKIYLSEFNNERNFSLKNFKSSSIIILEKNYKKAYQDALKKYKCIVFCGSLYFISEVYSFLKGEIDA